MLRAWAKLMMNNQITGDYHWGLMALSLAMAVITSYIPMDLAVQVREGLWTAKRWGFWLCIGAIAMGTGLWSMDFTTIVALELPLDVTYNLWMVLLSLLMAIMASGMFLGLALREQASRFILITGGICIGTTLALMDYLAISAIATEAEIVYDAHLVLFSVAIAIDVALISLWLAFRLEDNPVVEKTRQKVISAMVMGFGIGGMHYIGLTATGFIPKLITPITVNPSLSPSWLAIAVVLATVICLFFIVLTKLWDHKLVNQLAREKVCQDNEQQFRTLIQQMQVGMLLLNAKAEILVFNQAALDLLRLNIEPDSLQVFGEGWHLVVEDGSPISLSDLPVQKAIATGEAVHHVVMGFDDPKTQQRRWLLVNATLHQPGNDVTRVICTISDITNQKQTEEALRRSQERFTLAVEGANDGIWDWDISADEVYLSPRGKIMLGCDPDLDCFSNLDSVLRIIHPDDRLRVQRMLNCYLAKEIPAFDVEYRTELDNGERRWIRSRGVALWDEHNQPDRMVGFHTDVTDRKMAEPALREGAEQERSILQMVQQMRKTLELEQIFSATTGELRQALNCDRVLVYRFREDWSGEFMAESVTEGWVQLTATPLKTKNVLFGS
ncbi:MHYT domain-containing protein [Limnospira fusiformis]|uniref:MHYT domain-containing protein n=1 Tax=Limnospira fusiformis TaxID=54297 RepID=UPI00144905A0|nr:PAS domain S-box protein [Limnospira fusiformis SAG 85.79]